MATDTGEDVRQDKGVDTKDGHGRLYLVVTSRNIKHTVFTDPTAHSYQKRAKDLDMEQRNKAPTTRY